MLFRSHRRATLNNLRAAFPHMDEAKGRIMAKASFVFMAQSSLEALYFTQHSHKLGNVHIQGIKFLDKALEKKTGVVVLTAHLGNFPLMSLRLAKLGYPVWVMARPMRDGKADNYFNQLRVNSGVGTIFSYRSEEHTSELQSH